MSEPKTKLRWLFPTPAWLVYASLLVTAILFLSERSRWFPFNEHKGWTVLLAVAGVGVVLLLMLLWLVAALILRRQFQFGIRTLLVLTVAVALPFSWLGAEIKKATEQRKAVEALGQLGIEVSFDWMTLDRPPEPEWLRNTLGCNYCLGCDFFDEVVYAGTEHTALAFSDYSGFEDHVPATDAVLERLKSFTHLRTLILDDSEVTDAGLECIKGLRELKELNIRSKQVTDYGLKKIEGLKDLEWLSLGSSITNAGFKHLSTLNNLRELHIDRSFTDDDLNALRAEVPNDCKINPPSQVLPP